MRKALLILIVLILGGCTLIPQSNSVDVDSPEFRSTLHWMVDDAVMAASTQLVYEMRSEMKTMMAESPTETPVYVLPVNGTATATSIWQSNLDSAAVTMTPTPRDCLNKIKFVTDITVPDGTAVTAGKPFTKTWKMQNTGTCVWDENYTWVFESGDSMGAKERISLPDNTIVKPDDTIEISVYMTAPEKPGKYTGNWMMEDPSGIRFGTGDNNDRAIWVKVEVR